MFGLKLIILFFCYISVIRGSRSSKSSYAWTHDNIPLCQETQQLSGKGLNCTHQKGLLALVSVMVKDVKFVTMLRKHLLSPAPKLKILTKLITNLTAAKKSLFIYLHTINVLITMLGKPQTNFAGGGITINLMIGMQVHLAYRYIFFVIFQWQVTKDF